MGQAEQNKRWAVLVRDPCGEPGDVRTLQLAGQSQHGAWSSKAEREVDAGHPFQRGDVVTDVAERHHPLQRHASPTAIPASAVIAAIIPAACTHSAR